MYMYVPIIIIVRLALTTVYLVHSYRHRLLVEIARQYGYTKVLVGDNATRLAVRLLGNIAQGRGASLPLDTVITVKLK